MTPQQRNLLDFISAYISANGSAPSFEEMGTACGIASKSGVHRLLTALEEQGLILRGRNRARRIEVVGQGNNLALWSNQQLVDELVRRGVRLELKAAA